MGALILADAFSGLVNNSQTSPKLLATHFFDGSIGYPSPPTASGNRYYYSDATGVDGYGHGSSTIKNILNSATTGVNIRRETILVSPTDTYATGGGDVVFGDYRDIPAVFDHSIVPNDMPGGKGNKIVITQLKRSAQEWKDSYPQTQLMFMRRDWQNPLPTLCYAFKMKLPANMIDVLADNPSYQGWSEQLAIKSNIDNTLTDRRLALKTVREAGESQLRFRLDFDIYKNALPGTIVAGVPVATGSVLPAGPTNFWYLESALGAAIPGDIYQIYIYFKPPAGDYTDTTTGLVQILIVNLSKNTIALSGQKSGVAMKGYYNYEMARIYTHAIYTGGWPSSGNIQFEYSDFQFWSRPPLFLV